MVSTPGRVGSVRVSLPRAGFGIGLGRHFGDGPMGSGSGLSSYYIQFRNDERMEGLLNGLDQNPL